MVNKALKSSAFHGRIDSQIELSSFRLAETRELLRNSGVDEIMQAQMLTGGVPKYLRLLVGYSSIQLAMEDLAFTPNGYLTTEYDRLFSSHFARSPSFEMFMRALAEHPLGLFREQLAEASEVPLGGQMSVQLHDLKSAGFISTTTSIDHAWMGRSFELLCLQHSDLISQDLGFPSIDYKVGPYFTSFRKGSAGVQVDLLFDRSDAVLTLCETKHSRRPIGVEVIPEVERKVELLEPFAGRKTIQRVLVVYGTPTKPLVDSGYFYRIIDAPRTFRAAG
jgi:hypothetical protein